LSSIHNAPSDAMPLSRNDLLINVHEMTVLHNSPAVHKEVPNALGRAVHERRGRIGIGTGQGQAIQGKQRHIAPPTGFERADVFSPQAPGSTARGDSQRLAGAHSACIPAGARDEHRLAHLALHLAAIVRGGAVHSQPHGDASIEELACGGDPRAQT
jgi:hypothetical protein